MLRRGGQDKQVLRKVRQIAAGERAGGEAMGAELIHCAVRECVVLDTARITILRRSLGDQRTREVVEEVVFHVSDRMGLLRGALDASNAAEALVLAARLGSLSEQVGLQTFAQVARDLVRCLEAEDAVATAAVAARLARLAEDSLVSVIHYADQSAL